MTQTLIFSHCPYFDNDSLNFSNGPPPLTKNGSDASPPRGWGWIFLGAQTVDPNIPVQCFNPYKLAFSKMNLLRWFTPVKRKKGKIM
jgi:hypothetical protein